MKKEDLLAYVGIALAIPGTVLLFSSRATIGVLVLVLVVILFAVYRLHNRPVFTYMEVDKTLDFQDDAGQLARLTVRVKARPNHRGTTQLWFRGINADGSIRNLKIDGEILPAHSIKKVAGTIEVYKQFPQALTPGKVVPVELSYELHDSFPGNSEGLTHVTATHTKRVKLRVHFHAGRPIIDVRHYVGYGGQVHGELEKPAMSENRLSVECALRNPKIGSYDTVEWKW